MPQEFQVVRCYSCEVFQVHQVKKDPKWQCKICHEKQSLKHIYYRGSGADCRKATQEFNMKRGEISEEAVRETEHSYSGYPEEVSTTETTSRELPRLPWGSTDNRGSKWTKYT